jgi:Predicted metalloendopeptidase
MSTVIPLALIVQPYLRSDIPRYVAYATMGLILSHEMVHSLDLTGLRFDQNGFQNENWFTSSSKLR